MKIFNKRKIISIHQTKCHVNRMAYRVVCFAKDVVLYTTLRKKIHHKNTNAEMESQVCFPICYGFHKR